LAVGGLNGLIPALDFDGTLRPAGAGVDRGAFELGATTEAPVIAAVASTASGQTNSFVPGSLVTLYGSRLATTEASAQTLPLPTRLADTQVLLGDVAAGLVYAGGSQINFLVPDLAPGTSTSVTVVRGETRSAPVAATVVAIAPAVFEIALGPERRGAITDAGGALVWSGSRASPGQVLIAYLTGLGAADPVPGSSGLRTSRVRPRVIVEGREAAVQFAGPNPNFAGLDQINFVVPAATTASREVELWVEQADRKSNIVVLPVR
jgi:uncharacterized protein (TIGR03437 family)